MEILIDTVLIYEKPEIFISICKKLKQNITTHITFKSDAKLDK